MRKHTGKESFGKEGKGSMSVSVLCVRVCECMCVGVCVCVLCVGAYSCVNCMHACMREGESERARVCVLFNRLLRC